MCHDVQLIQALASAVAVSWEIWPKVDGYFFLLRGLRLGPLAFLCVEKESKKNTPPNIPQDIVFIIQMYIIIYIFF